MFTHNHLIDFFYQIYVFIIWVGGGEWKIDVVLWSKAVYGYFNGRARGNANRAGLTHSFHDESRYKNKRADTICVEMKYL